MDSLETQRWDGTHGMCSGAIIIDEDLVVESAKVVVEKFKGYGYECMRYSLSALSLRSGVC
jgi:hypothetical protein